MPKFKTLAFAAAALIGSGLAFAASAETLGERLANGSLDQATFQQLVADSGVTEQQARSMTYEQLATTKWKDD
jgi:hypothetical protein